MRRIVTALLLSLCLAFPLIACGEAAEAAPQQTSPASEPVPAADPEKTIEDIADSENSRIGEFQHSYFLPPSGGLSIESVAYHPEFDVTEKVLKNVIAVEVVSDFDALKAFMSERGTVQLFDKSGNEYYNLSSGAWRDAENYRLYMLYYTDEDISNYSYIVIGQFDSEKNDGKTTLTYEIAR